MLVKNRNSVQKSKFCSIIEILFKNRNSVQKSKLCSKIEILVKNRILAKNRNYYQNEAVFNYFHFAQKLYKIFKKF